MELAEPQAIIDQIGVFGSHPFLKAELRLGQGHGLQRLMRLEQHRGRRRLIHLPGLYPHQPILYVVDAAYPVLAGQHYKYLLRQIRDIAAERRRNANPDMVKVVKNYSDEELIAVVDYMSRLSWPERQEGE